MENFVFMSCLYLDASREDLSLGIYHDGYWYCREAISGRHDQVLLTSIHELCNELKIGPAAFSQCVVVNGPGSFTGLRITVSCIHALDLVRPLSVLPIDQLSLLSEAAGVCLDAVLDARMNEVYLGTCLSENGLYESLSLVRASELDDGVKRVCHVSEWDRLQGDLIPIRPTLNTLRDLAKRQPETSWIPGRQLTPQYVRQTVSWKPLTEQPSKLYDR
jgi:tRNA threonylcarbamoyl adenosine modification protein YeaZ